MNYLFLFFLILLTFSSSLSLPITHSLTLSSLQAPLTPSLMSQLTLVRLNSSHSSASLLLTPSLMRASSVNSSPLTRCATISSHHAPPLHSLKKYGLSSQTSRTNCLLLVSFCPLTFYLHPIFYSFLPYFFPLILFSLFSHDNSAPMTVYVIDSREDADGSILRSLLVDSNSDSQPAFETFTSQILAQVNQL